MISRGKGTLIIESLADGKRRPAFGRDHVISLGEVSIYTTDGDTPLGEVLESVKAKAEGKPLDIAALGDDASVRKFFEEVLPEFDQEKVHTGDIRKLLAWYNLLIGAGITEFKKKEEETPAQAEEEPKEEAEPKAEA